MPECENTLQSELHKQDASQQGTKKRRSLFSILFSNKQQQANTQLTEQKMPSKETPVDQSISSGKALEDAEEDPDSYELDLSERIQSEKDRKREEEELNEFLMNKGGDFHPLLATVRSMYRSPSLCSSEAEINLDFETESPALVINCSDDTSCSSVELIWSRSRSPEKSRQHSLVIPMTSIATSKCRESHQQLSVLELAKPIKAKNRSTPPSKVQSRSSQSSAAQSIPDDAKWVPNPLFSSEEELKRCEDCHYCDKLTNKERENLPVNAMNSDDDELETETDRGSQKEAAGEELKKRWSFRGKSPFNISRDNIYLNQIRNNLDPKKIRSNVSSIRTQLGVKLNDTGKRASILADQLIASIRDTTAITTKNRSDDESTLHQDSFVTNHSLLDTSTNQQFSLIYLHQQQANGQQVVTRQPQTMHSKLSSNLNISSQTASTTTLASTHTREGTVDRDRSMKMTETKDVPLLQEQSPKEENSPTGEMEDQQSSLVKRKERTKRKVRRQTRRNRKAEEHEDTDEEKFCEKEFAKFSSNSTSGNRTRLRSFNYWRRFRIRNQKNKL